jgi:hypothetical protein
MSPPTTNWRSRFGLSDAPDEGALSRPMVAFAIAWGSFALGGAIAIWTDEIREATKQAFASSHGSADLLVVAFWLVSVLWTWLLYRRLKVDDRKASGTTLALMQAILRTPNYHVVRHYRGYFELGVKAISLLDGSVPTDRKQRKKAIEEAIQLVLLVIAGMASEFAMADDKSSYGANIMLVAKPRPAPQPAFDQELVKALRFYDTAGSDLHSLFALLYLPKALLLAHLPNHIERDIPLISLPVPLEAKSVSGRVKVLPGAPWAVLTGEYSVYPDASLIAAEGCADLDAEIRDSVAKYFSASGDGKAVGSLMSVRIGIDPRYPVGVLNIDSNEKYLLGPEKLYYDTFFALLTPFLQLLEKPVTEYARLTDEDGEYLTRSVS